MNPRLRRERWPWQATAVALAVLALAVGLCLFDDDGAGSHDTSRDLCGGFLASALTVTLLALTVLNPVRVESLRPARAVSLRRLDPPPESLQLS